MLEKKNNGSAVGELYSFIKIVKKHHHNQSKPRS